MKVEIPTYALSRGPKGEKGEKGDPFNVSKVGTEAQRLSYTNDAAVTSYLSEDTGLLWIKRSPGVWPTEGVPFRGPQGNDGPKGDTGNPGQDGSDGADGQIGPPGPGRYDEYVQRGGTLSYEDWAEATLRGPVGDTGPKGDTGDIGPAGEDGQSFRADATGITSERADYDAQGKGFIFQDVSVDPNVIYAKLSDTAGDWSAGASIQGERGEDGLPGEPGPPLDAVFSGYELILRNPDGTEVVRKNVRGNAGPGVAVGGQEGHILRKKSGANYDTEFIAPPYPERGELAATTGASGVGWKAKGAPAKPRDVQESLESLPTIADYGARGKVFLASSAITATRDASMGTKQVYVSSLGADSESKINYIEVGDGLQIDGAGVPVDGVPRNLVTRVTAIAVVSGQIRLTLEHGCQVVTNAKCNPDDTLAMQDCMDYEPHFRVPRVPEGSQGWNVCGEWYLPGAKGTDPRATTIECAGYVGRIIRRGALNYPETRQIIEGQPTAGTPGPRNVTIKNLFLDGNSEELNFSSSDRANCSGISIICRDTNPLYHAYNIDLLDCTFKSIPGPVTFYANVHGGMHRCRAYGKLDKGGYQFVNNTTDFQVMNPVVEGSSDDAIGINAYASKSEDPTKGSEGGGQPQNIVITGGYLYVSKTHVGGRCISVLGGKDVTAVGVRVKGAGLPQINIQDSADSISRYQPENIDMSWYGVDSRLPHWNNIAQANKYNPGSPGLQIEANSGKNLRFDATIETPGGHGVYINHLGAGEMDVTLTVRVSEVGRPRTRTIENPEVEGYTLGQTVTNYKGHPSAVSHITGASYLDTQVGLYVDSKTTGPGELTLRLVRCRFETPRLQNVYISPAVRLRGLFVDGLRVLFPYTYGKEIFDSGGTPRTDVDQIYVGAPSGYPRELTLNGIRARDSRATKFARNHLRLSRAVAGYADMGSDNLFPAGETITGQRGFDVENSAQVNLRSAREQTIVFNAGVTDTAAANANGATATFAPNDPVFRRKINGRTYFKVRVQYSFGGSITASTRFRMQYMASSDLNSTGAWTTLVQSTGSHVVGTIYESADVMIPVDALVDSLLLRPVIYGGDGAASPTIRTCVAVFS